MSNEAAERLLNDLTLRGPLEPREDRLRPITEALAAERRAGAAEERAKLMPIVDLLWGGLKAIVKNTHEDRTIKAVRIIVEEARPLFSRLDAEADR